MNSTAKKSILFKMKYFGAVTCILSLCNCVISVRNHPFQPGQNVAFSSCYSWPAVQTASPFKFSPPTLIWLTLCSKLRSPAHKLVLCAVIYQSHALPISWHWSGHPSTQTQTLLHLGSSMRRCSSHFFQRMTGFLSHCRHITSKNKINLKC